MENGTVRKLTSGKKEKSFAWEDGEQLFFVGNREKTGREKLCFTGFPLPEARPSFAGPFPRAPERSGARTGSCTAWSMNIIMKRKRTMRSSTRSPSGATAWGSSIRSGTGCTGMILRPERPESCRRNMARWRPSGLRMGPYFLPAISTPGKSFRRTVFMSMWRRRTP